MGMADKMYHRNNNLPSSATQKLFQRTKDLNVLLIISDIFLKDDSVIEKDPLYSNLECSEELLFGPCELDGHNTCNKKAISHHTDFIRLRNDIVELCHRVISAVCVLSEFEELTTAYSGQDSYHLLTDEELMYVHAEADRLMETVYNQHAHRFQKLLAKHTAMKHKHDKTNKGCWCHHLIGQCSLLYSIAISAANEVHPAAVKAGILEVDAAKKNTVSRAADDLDDTLVKCIEERILSLKRCLHVLIPSLHEVEAGEPPETFRSSPKKIFNPQCAITGALTQQVVR